MRWAGENHYRAENRDEEVRSSTMIRDDRHTGESMARFLAWFWMGLVAGVSFIATPVKFRATSLTMAAALDVGHVTLHALNRIEWFLSVLLLFALARRARLLRLENQRLKKQSLSTWEAVAAAIVFGCVIAQSVWLLPALDLRTAQIMNGHPLPPSPLHGLFIAVETTKWVALFVLGLVAGIDSPSAETSA